MKSFKEGRGNFADEDELDSDWQYETEAIISTKIPLYLAQPAHSSGAHASASMTPTEYDVDDSVLLIKII